MDKNMQPEAMTLEEKKQQWVSALRRKLEMRTLEEWDFETMSETIYKDDILEFYRECQDDYVLENVHDSHAGVSACLDDFLDGYVDLGNALNIPTLRGVTLLDYLATKDYPITFKTWPEDTENERWDSKTCIRYGKRKQ